MASSLARPSMRLLRVHGLSVLRQLRLEEALLRTNGNNWCIISDEIPSPAIVMGISGKPAALLDLSKVLKDQIPVIKRFSGGGTVVVDESTLFVSLICSSAALPGIQCFPRPIMEWTEDIYRSVFEGAPGFRLREHDYVFGDKKFGGNAQSITKQRWVHHTSFLWDFKDQHMHYLLQPARAPDYRKGRSHLDFICRLRDYLPSKDVFISRLLSSLKRAFEFSPVGLAEVEELVRGENCHIGSRILVREELERCLKEAAGVPVSDHTISEHAL